MSHLRLLCRRSRRWQRVTCFVHWWLGCAVLLSGCSQGGLAKPEQISTLESSSAEGTGTWVLAPDAEQLPVAEQASAMVDDNEIETVQNSQFWAFSQDTRLICLPSVDYAELPVAEMADINEMEEPLGELLPPQECHCDLAPNATVASEPQALASSDSDSAFMKASPDASAFGSGFQTEAQAEPITEQQVVQRNRAIEMPAYDELSAEEQHLLDLIKRETLDATTGEFTDARLDQECRDSIGAAYALSQRGAIYAARQQLIEVLRKISQAKDNRDGTRSRTESLAAGLRALEEADDFTPRGSQLEGEMKLDIVCAAHRTPLAREIDLASMLPARMTERYNRFAQIKLAVAVAGEPAGSMALYSLGKLNSRLAATESEQNPLATRRAVAFQQAALLAHNENYMAAHELGVLLAETGHYPEAQHLLLQVAIEQPNAVVFHNLARVQDALGNPTEAQLCRIEAEQLAQRGRGPKPNIAWVSPQDFSSNQINTFTPRMANNSSAPAVVWR